MRFLPASDQALLVELPDLAQTMQLYRAVLSAPIKGVRELVPAARTLLVHYQPWETSAPAVVQALQAHAGQLKTQAQRSPSPPQGRLVEIPVRYDGEDLDDVAQLLGMSVAEVIERHTGTPYDAAFAGFAPGFVYLSGGANFQVPRRRSPRTKVPAGSVALGGNFSAVYPSASPGGWQLIGTTEVPMWDLARPEAAYVQPGFRVQFVDVARKPLHINLSSVEKFNSNEPLTQEQQALEAIELISVGLQTLVQDAGRHGLSGMGISESGALDRQAMRDANRLVGNPVATPVLENLLGQLQLRSHGRSTLAVAGADAALTVRTPQGTSWSVERQQVVALNDGDELHIAAPTAGVRSYVAVRGGWRIAPVLGSCSTDTLAHVGPGALQAGQHLYIGSVPEPQLTALQIPATPTHPLPQAGDTVVLDIVLGPRTDWFTQQALDTFTSQQWLVTPQSNRIGIRLQGEQALERSCQDELPSEGTVVGAIQVPINGQPVLFLADHPLTGGYPVIAAVASYHLDRAAQIPVGCRIRFNVIRAWSEYQR